MENMNYGYIVLSVLALAGVLVALGSFLYYRGLIGRLLNMLRRYQEHQWTQEEIAETRESKLEAQLRKLLRQSAVQSEQAGHRTWLVSDTSDFGTGKRIRHSFGKSGGRQLFFRVFIK